MIDFASIRDVIEFTTDNGPQDKLVRAYLQMGWVLLNCARQRNENDDAEVIVYSLGWPNSLPSKHLEGFEE